MSNYKILSTIDLTKVESLKELYETLLSLKKERFENNERIVFVYSQSSKEILKLVNELLIEIDIPDFFVIFEPTDYFNPNSINYSLGDNYCIYPWINLRVSALGDISPCCYFNGYLEDNSNTPLNIKNSNLKEIYLSQSMKELRDQFRQGKKPSKCSNCWAREKDGLPSMRLNGKYKYKELYYRLDWASEESKNLQLLDLNLGNLCNLSCRICSRTSSIVIGKQEVENGITSESEFIRIQQAASWPEDDIFWQQMEELIPQLKFLDLYGGEPMMSKKHFILLQKIVDAGTAQNIKIDYNTNGTFYSDKFFNLWQHFKAVKLSISLDDLKERFEYQRNGASWKEVSDNIKKYRDKMSNQFSIELFPTINIQNVYYMPELVVWANSLGIPVYFNMLIGPDFLSVDFLPPLARQAVIEKLSKFTAYPQINKLLNKITDVSYQGNNLEFITYTKRLDAERQQSFAQTHPEIAKLLDYR